MTDIKSKHILHVAKRRVITAGEMAQQHKQHPETIGFIGALPPKIIKNIPQSNRGNVTKQADAIFSNFAKSAAYIRVTSDAHYAYYNESFKRHFPSIICGLKETLNRNDIAISYIGSGAFKHCFLLSFGQDIDNKYVLQTFQNVVNFDPEYFPHGILWEPQLYFTTYKKYSHGRVAKPFIARPSTTEILSNGYILIKYIDPKHTYKTKLGHFATRRTQMTNTDTFGKDNTIHGITVDVGGFIENPEHISAQKTRYHWNEIAQVLDKINFSKDTTEVFGTLEKIYQEYGKTFFDTTKWPEFIKSFKENERATAKKILKSLLHLRNKCEKLHFNNDWEAVQKYILSDLKHICSYDYKNPEFKSEIINTLLQTKQK